MSGDDDLAALHHQVALASSAAVSASDLDLAFQLQLAEAVQASLRGPYEGKPDATFSFTDGDFIAIASGKVNPQIAFIRGVMKIKGSISAAQKFTPDIFPKPSKL